ncbi:sigma 54-interacting transcriptional regulator [Desulfotomaculum defluvii]
MKQSILREIQTTVMQYAKAIAQVIQVEVEIVDDQLLRIAGTGIYENSINEGISKEGLVFKQVLSTGEPQFIEDPGHHPLCKLCEKQNHCDEKLELCTPIKLDQNIIGVIGLICFNEEQKQHLLQNLEAYWGFLDQIAVFISAKAYEHQERERNQGMMQLLNHVINSVDKGVLIFNEANCIVHFNSSALSQLGLSPKCLYQQANIQPTGDSLLGSEEYRVAIGEKTFKLMGNLLEVTPRLSSYDKILIFNEIKNVKSGIYDLTNVSQTVTMQSIIGQSEAIQQLKRKVLKIADSNSTVLITGESGTGKEVLARAIHAEGNRSDKPFIAINCAAIPDTLLESELFGYVKGAFTGADPRGKIGKFELANRGIIFLDEVGDMPLYLQVKLLRVLQERKLIRIGSNQLIELDVRVIAATNQDLRTLIKENKFREDLYYRLNVIPIEIPPLRERSEDIGPLLGYMMDKYSQLFHKKVHSIDEETLNILTHYPWPGNVRELENTVEFMINMADTTGILTRDTLPRNLWESQGQSLTRQNEVRPLKELEREAILQAMEMYGYSTKGKQRAAQELGIGIATLYRKLEEYHQLEELHNSYK